MDDESPLSSARISSSTSSDCWVKSRYAGLGGHMGIDVRGREEIAEGMARCWVATASSPPATTFSSCEQQHSSAKLGSTFFSMSSPSLFSSLCNLLPCPPVFPPCLFLQHFLRVEWWIGWRKGDKVSNMQTLILCVGKQVKLKQVRREGKHNRITASLLKSGTSVTTIYLQLTSCFLLEHPSNDWPN